MTCVSQLMQLVSNNAGNSITFPMFIGKYFPVGNLDAPPPNTHFYSHNPYTQCRGEKWR
jgi:hypothetical protein